MRNQTQNHLSFLKETSLIQPQTVQTQTSYQYQKEYLLDLLMDIDGVHQNPKYHPEIDTLYHSLQVFQLALDESTNPFMHAAALFHDIGKTINMQHHAAIGADMVRGILLEPIPWLIEHHLDLLVHPRRIRKKFNNRPELKQLENLRRWDLQGRKTQIDVIKPTLAIEIISQTDEIFQSNK